MLSGIGKFLTSRSVLGVAAVVFAWLAWQGHFAKPPVKLTGQVQLNDSTVAAPAGTSLGRHELPALTDAADALHGKLAAGVSFHTRPDTSVRSLGEVTTVSRVDSTRTAVLVDTTKMGVILRVDAEAPAFPAPLKLGYSLTVPAFSPSVGFVQTGDSYAAVVTWADQVVKIDNAFVLPQPHVKLVAGVNVLADTAKVHSPEGYIGVKTRLGRNYEVRVAGSRPISGPWNLQLGLERVLWSR
jgi:hypothetical protein